MIIQFTLTMPQVNTWNGHWSDEDKLYASFITTRSKELVNKIMQGRGVRSWRYHWSDGWSAFVEAKIVSAGEAAKARRKSSGFYGYDWMIDSIRRLDKIVAPSDEKKSAIE